MFTPTLVATHSPQPDSSSTQVHIYDMIFTVVTFILLGIAGVVSNVFILVIIGRNKCLQSPCFLLICLECVCSLILALGHCLLGVTEATQLHPEQVPIRPRWLCYTSTVMLNTFAVQANNISISCVGVDRLFSLIAPTRYRQAGGRYLRGYWAFCLLYTAGTTIWGMVSEPSGFNVPVKCSVLIPFMLLTPSFIAYRGPFNLAIGIFAVILYAVILLTFKLRAKAITSPAAAQAFIKVQQNSMPTVKLLMVFCAITAVLPDIFMSSARFIPRSACYVGPVKASSSLAQITALYFGRAKFRECAMAALGYGPLTNAVGPAARTTTNQRQVQGMVRRVGPTR